MKPWATTFVLIICQLIVSLLIIKALYEGIKLKTTKEVLEAFYQHHGPWIQRQP